VTKTETPQYKYNIKSYNKLLASLVCLVLEPSGVSGGYTMSLRRTPPPASALPYTAAASTAAQSYDSDTPSERSESHSVCIRPKRRREQDDDVHDLKIEMRGLFSSLSDTVEKRFNEIMQQNNDLKANMEFLAEKYDIVLEKLKKLEEDRIKEKKYVLTLENRLEGLERKIKASGLEIRNVPSISTNAKSNETKEDMFKIVQTLAHSVGEDILESDIIDIYRTNPKNTSLKPIIVELKSILKKNKVLQAVKMFNKTKLRNEKLNTGHLNINGPIKPVFVSETLTFKTQKLFYMAREFAKDYKYSYCWTTKGLIYLRKNDNQPVYRVESEEVISKLMSNS
jgi:hypothetical protein